ncbi:MAG: substrate-binding domain-containing protein [Planctomycetota bacterium]
MRSPSVLLLLVSLHLFGTACGEDGSATAKSRRIAVVPKGTTHEFWKSIHAGALEAGRELGVEIVWKGPLREDDRAEQIKVVENLTTKGVDALVVAPLDDTALIAPLQEADAAGIPVVVIDSDVNWEGRVSFVATDNYRGGVLAAEELGRLLAGKGRVLMMRYMEGSASTTKREAGFLDTIARFAGIEVVSSSQYGGATSETAYRTAENLLINDTDLDGIFCPNESTSFGMLRALQDAGRAGSVQYVGFDASPKLIEALEKGEIHGLVLQNPKRMGGLGVRTAVRYLDGKAVEPRIDTGVALATPANRHEPAIRELLSPDLTVLDE